MSYYLWFRESIEDLERARKLVKLNDIKAAYFFLQQAIEKAFKGLLLKKLIFVKSHDISLLYDYISDEYKEFRNLPEEEVEMIKSLTIHYSASRYPDARIRFKIPEELYGDVNKVKRMIEIVEKILELSKKLLEKDPKFGVDERGISIDEIISKYINRIRKFLNLACVIVFGSRSRGDWKPWSDVDIVVIVHEMNIENFNELFKVLHEPLIEYRIYRADEALQAIREGDPTLLLALFEGIVVYDDGIYNRLRDLFRKLWRVEVLLPNVAYKFIRNMPA